MFSLSSIRRKLPALPALPLPNSLPLGIPPWALLLIPLLGSLAAVYSLIRAAGSGSWWPGVEALDEAGTAVEDAELKEEKHFGRKSWQQSGASSTRCKEYDVIICGGGTTGCVLAARLSEDPSIKVLMLEAGKAGVLQIFSRIPSGFARLFHHETASWGYRFAPHPQTMNRELLCPRGRMLGGCSSINAMMAHHCAPSDFDEIAELGFDNFSSATLEPYFKKSQSHVESPAWPLRRAGKEANSSDGPVRTSYSWINELSAAFVKACGSIGMQIRADVNDVSDGVGTMGVSRTKTFIHKGSRESTATAYLTPDVIARPNLHVAVGATVTRILFDASSPPRAVGVEFTSLDKPFPSLTSLAKGKEEKRVLYRAMARKDVLLTAGAFGSPQILKVSGVGPRGELERVGVKVLVDLPEVGTHLKEHLSTGLSFVAKKGISLQHMVHPLKSLPFLVEWLKHKTGPLTTNVAEALAFVRSTDAEWCKKAGIEPSGLDDNTSGGVGPDIELIEAPLVFAKHGTIPPPMTADESDFFSIAPILLRPKSHGTVTIVSKDVFVKPVIDARFLTDPHDIKMLIWGLKLCRKVAETEPLASLLVKPFQPDDPNFPAFADTKKFSDEELTEYLRGHVEVLYHPVGTVGLGRCLDKDLRVKDTTGLRVCDASIFPEQLSGHPMAPLIAIAEKFSDELKLEYGGKA